MDYLFVFGYIAGKYSRKVRNSGEALIMQSLTKYCENKDAHVLNNVTLRLERVQLRKLITVFMNVGKTQRDLPVSLCE